MKYKRQRTRVSKYISYTNDKTQKKKKLKRRLSAVLLAFILFASVKSPLKNNIYINEAIVIASNALKSKSDEFMDKTGEYITDFCFGYLKQDTETDIMVQAKSSEPPEKMDIKVSEISFEENEEEFLPLMPCGGEITSDFGERVHPLNDEITFHNGIDISASEGDEIKACFDGEVIVSEYNEYSGNYVILSHNEGYTSSYAHMSKSLVSVGDEVKKGDTIGLAGSTGSATGPHLHFEIRNGGTPLDPYALINKE